MDKFRSLFSFNGRARRSTYWAATLGGALAYLAVDVVLSTIFLGGFGGGAASATLGPLQFVGYALILAALITFYWISLATSVKRCHDRNKSGWFLLIGLIPFIGGFWLLLELGVKDGAPERNRYGPSPKFPESAANVFA